MEQYEASYSFYHNVFKYDKKSGMHLNKGLHRIKIYPEFIICVQPYFHVNKVIMH